MPIGARPRTILLPPSILERSGPVDSPFSKCQFVAARLVPPGHVGPHEAPLGEASAAKPLPLSHPRARAVTLGTCPCGCESLKTLHPAIGMPEDMHACRRVHSGSAYGAVYKHLPPYPYGVRVGRGRCHDPHSRDAAPLSRPRRTIGYAEAIGPLTALERVLSPSNRKPPLRSVSPAMWHIRELAIRI